MEGRISFFPKGIIFPDRRPRQDLPSLRLLAELREIIFRGEPGAARGEGQRMDEAWGNPWPRPQPPSSTAIFPGPADGLLAHKL